MALASTSPELYVVVSASGESDHIKLPPGNIYLLEVECDGAYIAEVKASASGASGSFKNFYDRTGANATFSSTATTNQQFPVYGGNCYALNVTSYASPITLKAYPV